MSLTARTQDFLNDLDRVARIRPDIAQSLGAIADPLTQAEAEGETASGKLGLERDIEDVSITSQNLRRGVFRLLVLGDMKRGKSTFLNALIGENLLPSDVNPCTALLTVLRYGPEKRVTIHFTDDRSPQTIDFASFKQQYTIDPTEAKALEERQEPAFPDVSHAVVEYPLSLLEKGVEIVDSPGLNDTEARNELSLGYINNCHAVLFVMRASQPCTLGERRYLENYIKDRGLSVFFLINAWDQVKESLLDPDDMDAVREAEERLRKVFRSNLAEYCTVDGYDVYDERVFEISAIKALRKRIKAPNASLERTGFPEFMGALKTFLTQERAVAELRQARTLARQTQLRVTEAVDRRIPMLGQDIDELKQRIDSVDPDFAALKRIRDDFKTDIRDMRDRKANAVVESFRAFVFKLEATFEEDFTRYQPSFSFLDSLNPSKQAEFQRGLEKAFQQYANDKFAEWTRMAKPYLDDAFQKLSEAAQQHGSSYVQVTDSITEKLTGRPIEHTFIPTSEDSTVPGWARWAAGLWSLSYGNVAGLAMAATGFEWQNIFLNLIATISITAIAAAFLGPISIPLFMALTGLGIGVVQADRMKDQMLKTVKEEMVKSLPLLVEEQRLPITEAVHECFNTYEKEAIARIDDDIQARKAEIENLLKQKESREIDRDSELNRLRSLEEAVINECQRLESTYQTLLCAV